MISIDQKKRNNHYKPGLTFYESVFVELLPKMFGADTILVGSPEKVYFQSSRKSPFPNL
ncbi:hypothetical protein T02_14862 [Trichinella nativa]|uniref:Uncharacterized protein n=1 Tax=Trichinella nativa TaxID=6335 RepID=A0A0V1KJP3_9BILA|nr:hypothetical protein T02_14862 [Trichinella nativa]